MRLGKRTSVFHLQAMGKGTQSAYAEKAEKTGRKNERGVIR